MITQLHRFGRAVLAATALLLSTVVAPQAQTGATPEGTVITNTATVTFTDANDNTYTPVTAQVSVTVGFMGGVDISGPTTGAPASPSTGNELTYTIRNTGNGTDSVTVSLGTVNPCLTITGYKIGTTTYATLAALNVALLATSLAQDGTVSFVLVYTVNQGCGGQDLSLSLTATSQRDGTKSDSITTVLTPPIVRSVIVTPDGTAVSRVPSNGTNYTATYTVANPGNVNETFNLGATASVGGIVTYVSVNGTNGTSGTVDVAAGGEVNVDVIYSVGTVAAGSSTNLVLTAVSSEDSDYSDTGYYALTVIRPAISLVKAAYRDNATTLITGGATVVPGEYIRYRLTVTNTGNSPASSVQVSDPLDSALEYVSSTGDVVGWTLGYAAGEVTGSLSGTLAAGASRFFWVRVRIR
jgi:uncharacterized repeat protein (TIGR01451 family)